MTPTVGEWLFGIDSEAFKKSVFMGQDAFESSWESASLRNRLNSIVNEADDVAGFDEALKALDNRRKVYKKTGGRGRIADTSAKIAALVRSQTEAEAKIDEVSRIAGALKQAADQQTALSLAIQADRKELDRIKDGLSRRKMQEEMRSKLKASSEESRKRLNEYVSGMGKMLPSSESLEAAKHALEAYEGAGKAESEAQVALVDIVERRRVLLGEFGGRIPDEEEMSSRKDLARRWNEAQGQLRLIEKEDAPAERPSFAVFRDNPDAVSQVSGIIADWSEMVAAVDLLAKTESEIAVESARWEEQSHRVQDALESVQEKRAALPANADSTAADLKRSAGRLRELDRERTALSAERDSLKTRIEELVVAETPEPSGRLGAKEEKADLLSRLDDAIERCSAADEAASTARDRELECAHEKERRRAELEVARAAKATSASEISGKKRSPAILVVCIAIAVVLAFAGFALSPGSPVSIGMWACAAIVAVAGGAIWARGSKRDNAPDEEQGRSDRPVEQAEELYNRASLQEESARSTAAIAQRESDQNREALEALVEDLPYESGFGDASLITRASLARERLANQIAAAEKASRLSKEHAGVERKLSEVNAEIDKIRSVVEASDLGVDLDAGRLAERVEQRAARVQRDADEVRMEGRRLAQALEKLTGEKSPSDLSDCVDAARKVLDATPDALSELIDLRRDLQGVVNPYARQIADWVEALSLKAGVDSSLSNSIDALKEELSAYQSYCKEIDESQRGNAAMLEKASKLGQELASWADSLGSTLEAAVDGSLFESLGKAFRQDSRLRWKESEAQSRLTQLTEQRHALEAELEAFVEQCGMLGEGIHAGVEAISRAVAKRTALENDARAARSQLEQWERDNAARGDSAVGSQGVARAEKGEDGDVLERRIAQNEQARDAVMKHIAQCEERRSALLKDLESYPDIKQSVRLLSQERQRDMDRLFTVQKTTELLTKARANLDGRYLGDLSNRFVDYANAWIGSEGLDAMVSDDFSISIVQNDQAHDLASYSSGYRDLLGMCFRMALIDTLYEKEKPFLVMDDPFSLLDEGKVGRAFRLLDAVSNDCQIIYFTCHPSRVESMAARTDASAFVLPEQRARRELPRARARREAEERERAQQELVESFEVVPVTRGKACIVPESKRHVITNNLFAIAFAVDVSGGAKDADFTASFIDEKGRSLCDRQSVSVINGKVVPERVRFNLSTKEDGGKQYDLVIHEEGRAPNELAARIPYKADISFTTDYF